MALVQKIVVECYCARTRYIVDSEHEEVFWEACFAKVMENIGAVISLE